MDFSELYQSARGTAANLGENGAVKFIGAGIVGAACD